HLDRTAGPHPLLVEKVKAGKLGMRTGEGFRRWGPGEADAVRARLRDFLAAEARKKKAERGGDGLRSWAPQAIQVSLDGCAVAPPLPACGERSTCERSPCEAKQVGRAIATAIARGGGLLAGSDSWPRPLTRIPSLRLRYARNPTSPRKRGEVK